MKDRLLGPLLLIVAVIASNSYSDYELDREFVSLAAGDSISYYAMAAAAPGVPKVLLPFHHAQRIAIPYSLGLLQKIISVDLYSLFRAFVLVAGTFAVVLVIDALRLLGVSSISSNLLLAIYIFNPYTFRYYLALPGMISDTGFVLGVALLLAGLVRISPAALLIGLCIASLSRQTGLLLIPGTLYWLSAAGGWKALALAQRIPLLVLAVACPAAIYLATAALAGPLSLTNVNLGAITSIVLWLRSSPSWWDGVEFLVRGFLPFGILAAFAAGSLRAGPLRKPRPEFLGLALMGAGICAQPILGGPLVSGDSVGRLGALALIPFTLMVGLRLQEVSFLQSGGLHAGSTLTLGALLALSSVHHIYTYNGMLSSENAIRFSVMYFVICGLVAILTWREAGRHASSD